MKQFLLKIKDFLLKVQHVLVHLFIGLNNGIRAVIDGANKFFEFLRTHPYVLMPLTFFSTRTYGPLGKACFFILLVLKYGSFLTKKANELQKSIDILATKLDPDYKEIWGKPIGYEEKACVFDTTLKNKVEEVSKPLVPTVISELREHIWTYNNWYDKERRKQQQERIKTEGGTPRSFDTLGDVL